VAQEELERIEALWALRECAASGCTIVFKPQAPGQKFHDDRCRKRANRWAKASREASAT
jgi:hypothetical protein